MVEVEEEKKVEEKKEEVVVEEEVKEEEVVVVMMCEGGAGGCEGARGVHGNLPSLISGIKVEFLITMPLIVIKVSMSAEQRQTS